VEGELTTKVSDVVITELIEPADFNKHIDDWTKKLKEWKISLENVTERIEIVEESVKYLKTYRNKEKIAEYIKDVEEGSLANLISSKENCEKQIEKIALRSGHHATSALLKSAEQKRKKRRQNIREADNKARDKIGIVSSRDIYMVGLGLYWGEGYKKGNQEFGFTNSDQRMIKFYINWLNKSFGIQKTDLILRKLY